MINVITVKRFRNVEGLIIIHAGTLTLLLLGTYTIFIECFTLRVKYINTNGL